MEDVIEREYMKLEPFINIYSGATAQPVTEVDREWMKFSNSLREILENSQEKREKFLNFLDKL